MLLSRDNLLSIFFMILSLKLVNHDIGDVG